jgi:hypothetical protein
MMSPEERRQAIRARVAAQLAGTEMRTFEVPADELRQGDWLVSIGACWGLAGLGRPKHFSSLNLRDGGACVVARIDNDYAGVDVILEGRDGDGYTLPNNATCTIRRRVPVGQ